MLHDSLFNKKDIKMMNDFYDQKNKMKHYPYEFSVDTSKLIKGLAFSLFSDYQEEKHMGKGINYGIYIYAVSFVSVIVGGYMMI